MRCPRQVLRNKPPVWNDDIEAYTLDFMSYVKLPSKKNFQLINENNMDKLYFMFGKVENDVYVALLRSCSFFCVDIVLFVFVLSICRPACL